MNAAARRSISPAQINQMLEPQPRIPINWTAVGVVMALTAHTCTAVWFAATLDRRMTNVEQQLPPGAIARLEERTVQMQKSLERLERSR